MVRKLKTQTILNRIIAAGYYTEDSGPTEAGHWGSPFMCNAAKNAAADGVIHADYAKQVRAEIAEYFKNALPNSNDANLKRRLQLHNLPSDYSARLAIYKDWKNRPIPEGM